MFNLSAVAIARQARVAAPSIQFLCYAGRGPNSNALYPPLAAVVAVAPNRGAFGKTGNLPGLPRPPLLGEVAKPIGFDGEV